MGSNTGAASPAAQQNLNQIVSVSIISLSVYVMSVARVILEFGLEYYLRIGYAMRKSLSSLMAYISRVINIECWEPEWPA